MDLGSAPRGNAKLTTVVSSPVMLPTGGYFVLAAFFEIAGCFAFWSWLRLGRTPWWTAAGMVSLVLFAVCLTRVNSAYAGRAFAAYGGVYIASSLLWLSVADVRAVSIPVEHKERVHAWAESVWTGRQSITRPSAVGLTN